MPEQEARALTGSIVLAADDPAALAQFYGALLADGSRALAVLQVWMTTAMDLGATSEDPPRQEPFGAEAWLLDPEGNRLLVLVLP
jgi:hypothetical protein